MADQATKETNGAPKKKAATTKSKRKTAAPKKSARKGDKWNKTDFVLQFSQEVKPQTIVERAEAKGYKGLTTSYAASIRSKAKEAGTWPKGGRRGAGQRASGTGSEAEFRRALQGITLDRARAILDEIEAAYEGR